MALFRRSVVPALCSASTLFLLSCTGGSVKPSSASSALPPISGSVFGGQQPATGTLVQL